ncbi:serine threonine phosphatase 2A 59 kDa regulatory subunit B gamma isoform-like [Cryptosporidium sp. chipmunk genotype I]|uniref:serine threonine phosphatase 2A 59 kDa regulatory subunit B gamma isoform-like n=1 Tax=Cryptosporidium sp. chipmunk genotype I TaxID=1280935 RepID=UPI00351A8F44|nr:serine threonine phosphatase 2A 59 kDa regulatory subunit B gamma isoform-like [Cryptosporidium sp. chipmunk genotype I]
MNRVFQSLRRRVSSSEVGNTQNSSDINSDSCSNSQATKNKQDSKNIKNINKLSNSCNTSSSRTDTDLNSAYDVSLLKNNEIQGTPSYDTDSSSTNNSSSSNVNSSLSSDLNNNIKPKESLNNKNNSFQNIQINKSDPVNNDANISFPPIEFIKNEKFAFLQAYCIDNENEMDRSSDEEYDKKESDNEISNRNNDFSNHHSGTESNFLTNSNLLLPIGLVETNHGISLTDDPFSALALLQNMKSSNEILLLIRKKLIACCITFNFTNNSYSNFKEKKRETLLELVEYINNNDQIFQEEIIPDVLLMITSNIFRPFNQCHANLNTGNSFLQSNNVSGNTSIQSSNHSNNGLSLNSSGGTSISESKDDEQLLEPSWPHLLVIYEFFLRFVISPQFGTKVAKKYIDSTFILKLIDLFQSFDPRERDYLKTILHRIYGKIMPRRSCIRKAMKHIFLRVIIDGEPYNGIAELLEIFVSIVNGFTIPLKEEHKIFLETALIPLHKAKYISSFHQQLIYCLIQYIEKDTKLSVPIIEGVLKYWPITNSSKQILFLNELEELLEITPTNYIEPILIPIFERLASCIQSPHFHVAERVLYLWNNDIIVNLINEYKYEIYPVLIKALSCNGKKLHWNPTVHGLSFVVNKVLSDTDPELFSQIIEQYNDDSANIEIQKKEREEYWKYIIELAESMD